MAIGQRTKQDQVAVLLGLWHGDRDSTGWASATLAFEIARLTKPPHARGLGDTIYPTEEGQSRIPNDKAIIDYINKGYKLWRGR